jgi:hypothetical protein
MRFKENSLIVVCAFTILLPALTEANVTYFFYKVNNNKTINAAAGGSQLFDASDHGSGKVRFTLGNTDPAASSTADIYFGDLDNNRERSSRKHTDNDGYNVPFWKNTAWHNQLRGRSINHGEESGTLLNSGSERRFQDEHSYLGNSDLRIGNYYDNEFGCDGGEPDITTPSGTVAVVPLPAPIMLVSIGTILVGFLRRRRLV